MAPDVGPEPPPVVRPEPADTTGASAGTISREDLQLEGDVRETPDGYEVKGAVHLDTEHGRVSFLEADMQLEFAADGTLRGASGRARIPSPHERIEFADPVQADIGFVSGRELNRTGAAGIRLKDDTDYFVYRIATAFEMRIATGETGPDAVKPVVVRAPIGGEIVMVVDYTDPMYYVHGAHDAIGAAGLGWSAHQRIPFVPEYDVRDLGAFDGGTTRTGTFPVFKVFTVTGQVVENETTEVHLSLEDPLSSSLRLDYRMGFNGSVSLDLFLKDIVGLEIPLSQASGGLWREVSTRDVFRGHAYVNGRISPDLSWWPTFLPVRPVYDLRASGSIESSGDFSVNLRGEYGWDLPTGRASMAGEFALSPDSMKIIGTVMMGDEALSLLGTVTADATSVGMAPPRSLLDDLHELVIAEVDARITEAENALENLQDATRQYEIELSLRGLRSSLPAIAQTARKAIRDRINAELRKHSGKIYYNSLSKHLWSAAAPHFKALDRLEAAAKEIRDNEQTRREIEAALRGLAARRTFSTTYRYKILGATVATVSISTTVLSTANANRLNQAADNVRYIKEASDRKIRMQQIYDAIPSKEIFAKIRKDIADGVAVIPALTEFGFVIGHTDAPSFGVYAILGGKRHELGAVNPFDPASIGDAVSGTIVSGFGG